MSHQLLARPWDLGPENKSFDWALHQERLQRLDDLVMYFEAQLPQQFLAREIARP